MIGLPHANKENLMKIRNFHRLRMSVCACICVVGEGPRHQVLVSK